MPEEHVEMRLLADEDVEYQCSSQEIHLTRCGRWDRWRSGWKFTLSLASGACVLVFCLNLAFLLWTVSRDRLSEDRGVLQEGECSQVRKSNTVLHLVINILSTVLLASSNYGMQCLSAPTRSDVDAAHERGNYLDIGVPSLRNIRYLPVKRSLLWLCLGLSSLPLHLIYNSLVFYTTAAYSYPVYTGHSSFGLKSLREITLETPRDNSSLGPASQEYSAFEWLHQHAQNGSLERLEPAECMDAYSTAYQTQYGGVLLVNEDANTAEQYNMVAFQSVQNPGTPISYGSTIYYEPYTWLCPQSAAKNCSSHLSSIRSEVVQYKSFTAYAHWSVTNGTSSSLESWEEHVEYKVDYCLSKKLPERCKLQYSLGILIAVSVANIIKAVLMGYLAVSSPEPPMLTTGDAVASCLHKPDKRSIGKCLVPVKVIRELYSTFNCLKHEDMPFWYRKKPRRWGSTVWYGKWATFILLWLIVIITAVVLLATGLQRDGVSLWEMEFGTINPRTLLSGKYWPSAMISNTIVANVPQVIFSMLYFNFNSIMTSMTLAAEWSRYAITRRGLRVSWNPQSSQRSSYFLSLPYRYALPLMVSSAILHWLISQSIFLVGVEAYTFNGAQDSESNFATCGYTPVAMVSALSVGGFMCLCLAIFAFHKFASGMFVAGSCSVAIAAACHPTYDPNLDSWTDSQNSELDPSSGIEEKPLMWGAVPVQGEIGHCAFSDKEVYTPRPDCLYQ